jgi:hypothetical protein
MGGYREITEKIYKIPRGILVTSNPPYFNVYCGDSDHLHMWTIDTNGNAIGNPVDITADLFPDNNENLWSFDSMFSALDDGAILIAHAAPNLQSIDSAAETPVWFGQLGVNAPLRSTGIDTSGGIVVLHPYLFIFGNYGNVSWTAANNPSQIVNSVRVTSSKIVAGFATRGGNSSPAGILWSLDSLIRVTEVGSGAEPDFVFDTISSDISILSSRSVVEYDGIFFWAGVDRFFMYNGVVSELPNSMSLDFFFKSINMGQRQKVWATKVTKWGEVWWHFPEQGQTECSYAIIYNIREQTWYDTKVYRSCGYFNQVFGYPIWADSRQNSLSVAPHFSNININFSEYDVLFSAEIPPLNSFSIWKHEDEVDAVKIDGERFAIESYVESGSIAWAAFDPNQQRQQIDRYVDLYRVEPDLNQAGRMALIVNGKEYARSEVQTSSDFFSEYDVPFSLANTLFSETGDYVFYPNTDKIDLREQRREMNLKFVSKVLGGYYELGQILITARIGDARQ